MAELSRRDNRYVENLVKAFGKSGSKHAKKDIEKVMLEKGYNKQVISETLKRLGK